MISRVVTYSANSSTAIILCENTLKQYLINYARPLIYTTFMPPTTLAAIKVVYEYVSSGNAEPVSMKFHFETVSSTDAF